jgi:hypothetical protein
MSTAITFSELAHLTGGRLGQIDVACPLCGPHRVAAANRRRKVLRLWYLEQNFISYNCVRCDAEGYALANGHAPPPRAIIERMRLEAAAHQREHAAKRLALARWLWSRRRPIVGTIAETYLRDVRGIDCALPNTLGFLPASDRHHPAMIAAFGIPVEPEPGTLVLHHDQVRGVHLTRLKSDGSGKADDIESAKIMIGRSSGWPLVLAPLNDGLALAVCEGVEDGLSIHQTTGIGTWVAGCWSRLPALAERVPGYVNCVTIFAHADSDGQRGAAELARNLRARGLIAGIAR